VNMKSVVLFSALAVLVAVVAAERVQSKNSDLMKEFFQFQRDYNRTYASKQEFEKRFIIFKENYARAQQLTIQHNHKARFGVTQFSDLSPEEFKAHYLTAKFPKNYVKPPRHSREGIRHAVRVTPDPTNFDWDSAGVVTGIYNQGQCGSCWAFSATETVESYWALAGNSLTELSMEQIVDCDTNDDGCGGGEPSNAYDYIQSAGGLEGYSNYPYTAGNGQAGSCQFSSSYVVATISGSTSIDGEDGLYEQLSSSSGGPVSVCVDASSWQSYQGGVLQTCGDSVDHCVQAVGYANYNQDGAYWIVRNSWGESWGESGFIWIAIGQDLCAIGDYATVVSI